MWWRSLLGSRLDCGRASALAARVIGKQRAQDDLLRTEVLLFELIIQLKINKALGSVKIVIIIIKP
jgi:hypothetical protein